jgi:hypothetical protein
VEGRVVLRIAQQRLDPALVCLVRGEVLLEQQLTQENADADVRKRAERENPMRRADEAIDLGVLGLELRDDVADRFIDERKPDLFGTRHPHRIVRTRATGRMRRVSKLAGLNGRASKAHAPSRRRRRVDAWGQD